MNAAAPSCVILPAPPRDFVGWRRGVAAFLTAWGCREELQHVDEGVWRGTFERGLEPCDAVIEALSRLH